MKNKFFTGMLVALLLSLGGFSVNAQTSPTASKEIYNWTPYGDVNMLNLFYDVLKQGRNYPTPQEIRNTFGFDMEFSRSHVRPHAVM